MSFSFSASQKKRTHSIAYLLGIIEIALMHGARIDDFQIVGLFDSVLIDTIGWILKKAKEGGCEWVKSTTKAARRCLIVSQETMLGSM